MGNDQSKTSAARAGTGLALTIVTAICPPVGIVAAAGGATGGAVITTAGLIEDDPETISTGIEFLGMGAGGVFAGASGSKNHTNCVFKNKK